MHLSYIGRRTLIAMGILLALVIAKQVFADQPMRCTAVFVRHCTDAPCGYFPSKKQYQILENRIETIIPTMGPTSASLIDPTDISNERWIRTRWTARWPGMDSSLELSVDRKKEIPSYFSLIDKDFEEVGYCSNTH